MARNSRCGCSEQCSCRIAQQGRGIRVSGTGSQRDPFVVDFYGADVVGPGIGWSNNRLQARIGEGLEFGPSGEIVATGEGNGGGSGTGTTVQSLIDRGSDVVGGMTGAGYFAQPMHTRSAVEWAAQRGVDIVHVRVYPLADGTPACSWGESMSVSQANYLSHSVSQVTPQAWDTLYTNAGVWPGSYSLSSGDRPDQDIIGASTTWVATRGWFGYAVANEHGLLTLAETLRRVQRRSVVLIDVRLPGEGAELDPQLANAFLAEVRDAVSRYGTQPNVVATTDRVSVPAGDETIEPLTFLQGANLAVGPWITGDNQADIPADDDRFGGLWTFAFVDKALGADTVQSYADGQAHTLVTNAARHHEWDTLVAGTGALGAVCLDAEYVGGRSNHPVLGDYAYRHDRHGWDVALSGVETGMVPFDESPDRASSRARGWPRLSDPPAIHLGGSGFNTRQNITYHVLQGWMCPTPTGEQATWALEFGLSNLGAAPEASSRRFLAVGFCLVADVAYDGWTSRYPQVDPENSGYAVTINMVPSGGTRTVQLWHVDGPGEDGAPQILGEQDAATDGDATTYYRIGVNPQGIRVDVHIGDGQWGTAIEATGTAATRHRGGYVYFGRCEPQNEAWVGRLGIPVLHRGLDVGPQPGLMSRMGSLFS